MHGVVNKCDSLLLLFFTLSNNSGFLCRRIGPKSWVDALSVVRFPFSRRSGIGSSVGGRSFRSYGEERKAHHGTTATMMSSSPLVVAASAGSSGDDPRLSPPVARRDESAVVLAGKLPPCNNSDLGSDSGSESDSDDNDVPRQAADSPHPLLDPPRPIPSPYGWMRSDDRSSEEVKSHLEAENAYTFAKTSHLSGLRSALYDELIGAVQETDHTVPAIDGKYFYYLRTFEGKAYPVHCRAPVDNAVANGRRAEVTWDGRALEAAENSVLPGEVVYLDENKLAEGHSYLSTGSVSESESSELLCVTADFSGDEIYGLSVTNMRTGEIVDDGDGGSLECDGSVVWGANDSTLFYTTMDAAHRSYRVYRRTVGREKGSEEKDELLLEELDDLYFVGISKSADRRYLFVDVSSSETSEVYFLDLSDPASELKSVARRRKRVLYEVEHRVGRWLITTNWSGDSEGEKAGEGDANIPSANMRLMTCLAEPDSQDSWVDMRDNANRVMFDGGLNIALDGVQPFHRHAVAVGRQEGTPRIWIISFGKSDSLSDVTGFVRLTFPDDSYDVSLGANYEYSASAVILGYESPVTPIESLLVDMNDPDGQRTLLKAKNVPGYDRDLYASERVMVRSRDGETDIPVSLIYRKNVMEQHLTSGDTVPVHLYGYGSYGDPMEDDFDSTRLPLLNRGMVYVIAHVRGGGEMGRTWYEEPNGAKLLCKKNTFNDFVDVGRWLVEERKLTTKKQLSCEGRSAGGLLIGASVNQAPDLFSVAILGVPFVDVVATMTDASIPLTAGEWEEWGNPNELYFFDYMTEYCPMSNVQEGATYPSMLLTGGLHDPRVQYWEPAKLAATLRHIQGDSSGPVCLKIDMAAGHFSASDRYKYLKELSFDYAFLLNQLGLAVL